MIDIPTQNVEAFIFVLAATHGDRYVKGPYDDLADTITRLSGDEFVLDEIERLVIALERAGVIASDDVVPLHHAYLTEKFGGPNQ